MVEDKSTSESGDSTLSFELKFSTGPWGLSTRPGIEQIGSQIQTDVVPEYQDRGVLNGEEQAAVLVFFSLSHAAIELRSIDILSNKLASKEYANDSTKEFFEFMTQKQREELLLRTGLIPSHVHSYLNTARETRNKLIHNPRQSIYFDIDQSLSNSVEKTLKAVEELDEIYTEVHMPDEEELS